ncbi:NusB antitermination factor [Thermocrinis albus DSM 14484]|uniref:Transcription antitermination protein NusB n=1 Tax=Thermocrinis albus (strain DSM 14484 / JCM 11386 / HI 11/12) TaxID=638303 RepID=D3SMB9_THEAH|nr:transcription antitermination factor NusB [Thermocrinis albus]ADC89899.1 NusB antitermination factor [Thermocrinis albus DSM 14484]
MIYKPKAREDAFLILYQWEMKGEDPFALAEEYIRMKNIKYSERRRYVRKMVRTFMENWKEVDKILGQMVEDWDLDRLGYVERNILRVALTELMFLKVKNPKQAIFDYVKLTLKYAGKTPARFVNGVLGRFLRDKLSFA